MRVETGGANRRGATFFRSLTKERDGEIKGGQREAQPHRAGDRIVAVKTMTK